MDLRPPVETVLPIERDLEAFLNPDKYATAAAVLSTETGVPVETIDELFYEHCRPKGLSPWYRSPGYTHFVGFVRFVWGLRL